jgi:hypothetical protein
MLVDLFQAKVILPLMKIWFGHKRGDAAPERAAHFAQGWLFFTLLKFKYTAGLQICIRSFFGQIRLFSSQIQILSV